MGHSSGKKLEESPQTAQFAIRHRKIAKNPEKPGKNRQLPLAKSQKPMYYLSSLLDVMTNVLSS
jgi:hypothetical protein